MIAQLRLRPGSAKPTGTTRTWRRNSTNWPGWTPQKLAPLPNHPDGKPEDMGNFNQTNITGNSHRPKERPVTHHHSH